MSFKKTELTFEQLKDIVSFCGGNAGRVDKCIEIIKTKHINNLTDLSAYIFKEHYSFVIDRKDAPNLMEYFDDIEWDKYQTYSLDDVLEMLSDIIYSEHGDKEDFNDDLNDSELVDKYFPKIAKELIDLKFGSMTMDW